MNYYYETGEVGFYKGYPVYMIDEVALSRRDDRKTADIIFAVKDFRGGIELVFHGKSLGHMSHEGVVDLRKKEVPYVFYKEKEKEVKVEVREEEAEIEKEINFSDYSQEVDNFFKGLKELWGEMEKSMNVDIKY